MNTQPVSDVDTRTVFERFPDIMADCETTGTNFDRNGIIQISAVRFNLVERTIYTDSMFNRCLELPNNRFWDEGTRNWWMKKKDLLVKLIAKGEDPRRVLVDFAEWGGGDATMWAKPTHFDHVFFGSYYQQFNLPHPFHFRKANDVNSFLRSRYFPHKPPAWEKILPFEGIVHDAIFDVLHQIKVLFKATEDTKTKSIYLASQDPAVDTDAPF